MNKLIMTPIALSLLIFMLIGCGEGEDAIFSDGSGEFKIASFDSSSNAIARIDTIYRNGERDVKKTNVVGNYNKVIDNLEISVVLLKQFEGTREDKNIEVNGRTVKWLIYENNNNNNFSYETTYKTLDLSGTKANSYNAGDRYNKSSGILTDLNNYTKIPSNTRFPSGSVCYIPVTTTQRSFFVFNNNNKTGYSTLNDWTVAAEKQFTDNRPSSTVTVKAGVGNKQEIAQVRFFAINNEPEYIYNGVDYNSGIYEANYINKDQALPNEDSNRGVVDCTLVNEVAADFLAKQISDNY